MKTLFQCEPSYEAALRAAGLLNFDFLMKAKGGPPASRHAHRETIPLEIAVDGQPRKFFLKRVFKIPPKHALVPLLRGRLNWSQPRQEWETLGKLSNSGISAMRRVAYGERRRMGIPIQALLLVEAAPMPFTLENWLLPGFQRPFELTGARLHRLAHDLGQFVSLLHASGFRWPDIHPKHIFAEPPTDRQVRRWKFCLIDVERMEADDDPVKEPQDDRVLRDLRNLFDGLRPLRITLEDVRRFWAGYRLTHRQTARKKGRIPFVHMPTIVQLDPLPRLPDDYEHPHAVPLQEVDRMFVDPRVERYFSQLGWRDLADVFTFQDGQALNKPGLAPYRERLRIPLAEGNGSAKAFYLKRYQRPPLGDQLRRIREFRASRSSAAREVHFLKRLARIGVPSMRYVAYGQEMNGIWERRSFAVTVELSGQSLEKLVGQWAADPASRPVPRERREIVRQLGLLVRLLHEHDLFHRDLYLAHVFLTRNADGQIVLRLIDVARMIERPLYRQRWVTKDLAALAYSAPAPTVTRTDRIRFLYHYVGDRPKKEKKLLVRQLLGDIEAKVRKIARHDRRRSHRWTTEARA